MLSGNDFFALRTIRSSKPGPAVRYVACSVSKKNLIEAATRAFDDRNDTEGRERLEVEQEPTAKVKIALAVLAEQGEDYQLFPITAKGADEFIKCARKSGLTDEARAHVRLFI